MNIGEIRNVNGRLMGSIATQTIDLPRIGLRPVESDNPKAPLFEVVALNVARRWVQIGALWRAESQRPDGTPYVFLAGNIDDPSLPETLPVALFPTEQDGRQVGYSIAWRRETVRADVGGGFGASNRSYDERPQDGGFGESTAGPNGALVGADSGVDDEVPFA